MYFQLVVKYRMRICCIPLGSWVLGQPVLTPMYGLRGERVVKIYIGTHADDVLVVAIEPTSIFTKLKETYTIKYFGEPNLHLYCDYAQVNVGYANWWVMGYLTYTPEYLRKVCALLMVTNLWKEKFPSSPGYHPELDSSNLMCEEQYRLYHNLVVMADWIV